MLVKSSNVQQKHHKLAILAIFFLSLVLISLSFIATVNCRSASTDQIAPAGWGFGPIQDGEHIQLTTARSANSIIIPSTGKIYGWIVEAVYWGGQPNGARWMLRDPSNKVVYQADSEEFEIIERVGTPSRPPWWPFFLPWPEVAFYVFAMSIPDIKVPAFPTQGGWKLELYIYDTSVIEHNMLFATWHFSVGESDLMDSLFAPLYLTLGGVPVLGWGAFSTALPGIFWLVSPAWILGIFFIALVLYTRSFKLAIGLIKESGKRFKEAITKRS